MTDIQDKLYEYFITNIYQNKETDDDDGDND